MLKRFYSSPAGTIAIILVLTVLGIQQFLSLPIALYPNTSRPVLNLKLASHPLTAKSFRDRYGVGLETALQSINAVENVEAFYKDGKSEYSITFDWGSDLEDSKADIRSAVGAIINSLPEEYRSYSLRPEERNGGRIFFSMMSEDRSIDQLYLLLDRSLRGRLEQLGGVENVFLTRPTDKVVSITLDPDVIAEYAVDPEQVRAALRRKRYNQTLGYLSLPEGGGNFKINVAVRAEKVAELRAIAIGKIGDRDLLLSDVASVMIEEDIRSYSFRGNGKDSLIAGVSPKPEANIEMVAQAAKKLMEDFSADIKSRGVDFRYEVLTDPSLFIKEAIQNVIFAICFGMATAVFTLFLFVGSIGKTLVVGISIPISLLAGIVTMSLLGIEINLISMGAMALAVGMVVDGSIVVFENILRRLEDSKLEVGAVKESNTLLTLIYDAVVEVRVPVVISIMTTVIVFVPIIFTLPLTAAILGDLAKVIVSILSLSAVVTIFLLPPLCLILLKKGGGRQKTCGIYRLHLLFSAAFEKLKAVYLRTLKELLLSRQLKISFLVCVALLFSLSTYLLFSHVEKELMATPNTDKAILVARFQETGITKKAVLDVAKKQESRIQSLLGDRLKSFMTIVSEKRLVYIITLRDKNQIVQVIKDLEDRFTATPSLHFYINDWNPTSLKIPDPPLLEVEVHEADEEKKRETLRRIKQSARLFDEVAGRIPLYPSDKKKNGLTITLKDEVIRRAAAADNSINATRITNLIKYALRDHYIQSLNLTDGEQVEIRMGFPEYSLTAPAHIENLMIRVGLDYVPLRHFITVDARRTYSDEYAKDGKKTAVAEIYAKQSFSGDKSELRDSLKSAILTNKHIDSRSIQFVDTDKEVNDNILSLARALCVAIMLIFLVIIVQFGRLADTLNIMLAIPVGFMGVGLSLFVFSSTLSINSMLGLILLCGTAVNNSIIFVDFYRSSKSTDKEATIEADILNAASLRFRPIMVTTITTILGMLPVAFAYGSGGEILQPLGIAVSGGLGISTLFTLFIVPLMLSISKPRLPLNRAHATAMTLALIGFFSFSSVAKAMGLEAMVEQGLKNNLRLKELGGKREAMDAETKKSLSLVLPSLSSSGQSGLQRSSASDVSQKSMYLEIRQPIYAPQKISGSFARSDLKLELATIEYGIGLAAERTELYRQFFELHQLKRALQIREKILVNTKKISALVRKNFNNGLANRSDKLRAEVLRIQSESNEANARELETTKAKMLLNKLLMDSSVALPVFSIFIKKEILDNLLTVSGGFGKKPTLELRKKNILVDIAKADIRINSSVFLPEFGLSARQSVIDRDENPTLAATFTWNLFNGGRDYQDRIFKEKSLESVLHAAGNQRVQDQTIYDSKLSDLKMYLEDMERKSLVLKLSSDLFAESEKRYKRGEGSLKSLVDDKNSMLQAELSLITLENQIIEQSLVLIQLLDVSEKIPDLFLKQ